MLATRLRTVVAPTLIVLLLVSFSACDQEQQANIAVPEIVDATQSWGPNDSASWTFRATVTSGSYWDIDAVYVRYQPHFWEGADAAIDGAAIEDPDSPGTFVFTPTPPTGGFRRNDAVRFQWFVEYSIPDGQDVAFVESDPSRLLVGTTAVAERAALLAEQAAVLATFNVSDPHIQFPVVPHGYVSISGQGVPFANPAAVPANGIPANGMPTSVAPGVPALLLYAPRPQGGSEPAATYQAAMTDQVPDPPYTLIGWAYGALHDPTVRPVMTSIGSDHWFIHEAGWHTIDGGMVMCAPSESVPGEATAPLPSVGCENGVPHPGYLLPHPRVWDLHMWRSAAPTIPPALTVGVPTPLPFGGPLPTGIAINSAGFFASRYVH